jgi:hypothetical protein
VRFEEHTRIDVLRRSTLEQSVWLRIVVTIGGDKVHGSDRATMHLKEGSNKVIRDWWLGDWRFQRNMMKGWEGKESCDYEALWIS